LGNTKCYPTESIDDYYNRFHELLDDLADAEEPISTRSAIRQFIFTLGPEFETIQNNFHLENLPKKWNTQDWPSILVLCRDYFNSIKPQGVGKKESSPHLPFDCEAHQHKIKMWFGNPAKHRKDIVKEQLQYPGKCLYHLSKTHSTDNCHVIKAIDKTLGIRSATVPQVVTAPTGQLRHIMEELYEDAADDVLTVVESSDIGNDTNEESLLYFAHLSKHYLRLVTTPSSTVDVPRHTFQFPVIADSGANYHMFHERCFFDSLSPAQGTVLLGDGATSLNIKGVGTVKCLVGSTVLTIPNVRYIPDLSKSIYSLFQHIQTPDHQLESSYENGLFVIFPTFQKKAIIGRDDLHLDFQPLKGGSSEEMPEDTSINSPSLEKCYHVTTFQQDLDQEITYLDNLIKNLRDYYNVVKTKRQLGFNVPAGFQRDTNLQQTYRYATPPRKTRQVDNSSIDNNQDQVLDLEDHTALTPVHSNAVSTTSPPMPSSDPPMHVPIVRSVDKVSSSLPKVITMLEDFLRGCVSFRKIDTLKQHFSSLYQETIKLDKSPPDAILDSGNFATLRKKSRNTSPVQCSDSFGDVIHMDIIFGPEIAIGNIHYGIIFTDRCSRMTYIYPLHNLTSDIPQQ
jgi:hypothetical protein